jgi:hypothetical protein
MMKSIITNRPQTSKKGYSVSFSKMDAIASGVQVRIEEATGCSKRVTDETANIARSLGVPNAEIERWVTDRLDRLSQDRKRMLEIKTLLQKAYRF